MAIVGRLINGDGEGLRFIDRSRPALLAGAALLIAGIAATYFRNDIKRLLKDWKFAVYTGPALLVLSLLPGINWLRIYLVPPMPSFNSRRRLAPRREPREIGAAEGGLHNPTGANLCFLNSILQRMARTDLWTTILNDHPRGESRSVRQLRGRLRDVVFKLRRNEPVTVQEVLAIRRLMVSTGVIRDRRSFLDRFTDAISLEQHDATEVLIALRRVLSDDSYPQLRTVELVDFEDDYRVDRSGPFKDVWEAQPEGPVDVPTGVFRSQLDPTTHLELRIEERDTRVPWMTTAQLLGQGDVRSGSTQERTRCLIMQDDAVLHLPGHDPWFTPDEWSKFRFEDETYEQLESAPGVRFLLAAWKKKRTVFREPPRVLELSVGHGTDFKTGKLTDRDCPFRADLTLDLDPLLEHPSGERLEYELTDVICRRGDHLGKGGHYWYICRDPEHPDRWIQYNDERVTTLTNEQFLHRVRYSGLSFLYLPKESSAPA